MHIGWLDRLLGRRSEEASPAAAALPRTDEAPVPLRVFREYQTQTSIRFAEVRHQYQEVVMQNHELRLAVNEFTRRLDAIQSEQAILRENTEQGLTEVRHEVALIRVGTNPGQRERLQSALSVLATLQPPSGSLDRRSKPTATQP